MQRVPTLPTPTTLRAMSTTSKRSSSSRRSSSRVALYWAKRLAIASFSSSSARCMTSGGWSTMRREPSTTSVSLPAACRLSRLRALAKVFSAIFSRLSALPAAFLTARLAARHVEQLVGDDVRVPDVELVHLGVGRHVLAVGAHGGQGGLAGHVLAQAVVAAGQHEARRQALEVPLERSRQRLVEVVDVEQQLALGRAVQAEVREVGVAAELHGQARCAAAAPGRRP